MTRRKLSSGSQPNGVGAQPTAAHGASAAAPTAEPLVLVADAQRLFAQALGVSLERRGGLTAASSYPIRTEAVIEAVDDTRPNVVLMDLWIPGERDALAATRVILSRAPKCLVLHLTWIYGVEHAQASLAAGASALLPKTLTVALVAQAVHRAVAGEHPVYADEINRMADDIAERSIAAEGRRARFAELSAREVEVLRLLAEGCPARVLPDRLMVSAGTMRNQIHQIIKKLGVHTQQDAVRVARQQGLIPPDRGTAGR